MPSYCELAQKDTDYQVATILPANIEVPAYDYQSFFDRYALGEHGLFQDSQALRFSVNYGYQRDEMLNDLGADAHPLGHMPFTHNQILRLIAENSPKANRRVWSPLDLHEVRLTSLLHDIGECEHPNLDTTCGDIPFGKKTAMQRKVEAQVRATLYEKYFPELNDNTLTRMENLIWHREQSVFHDTLEAAHSATAYHTALRAGKLALSSHIHSTHLNTTPARLDALTRLGKEVSTTTRTQLEHHTNFPYINRLLEQADVLHQKIQEL